MEENQSPLHYTPAEETRRVLPSVDSGDGGVHIPRERVTHVEARPAGSFPADELSNSVQITLAKPVIKPASAKAMSLAAKTYIPISDDEISSVSNLGLKVADGTKVVLSVSIFNAEEVQNVTPLRGEEPPTHFSAIGSASAFGSASAIAAGPQALPDLQDARDSKLGTWLLAAAVISVTTLFTICNPKWVPGFVAQTVRISKQLSADIKRRASIPLPGTAVKDTAKAGDGTVAGAAAHVVTASVSLSDVDRSAAQNHGSSSGAHRTLASGRDETGTRDFMNQGFNQGLTVPTTTMPKAAEAKTSKSQKGLMVPPPPPTPCVLPPAFDFFLTQPDQPDAAPQQQLQQAQAQASSKIHNQAAARENTPQQSTAASGKTESTQSAAQVVANQELQAADQELQDADKDLQAALRSSLHTMGEWTR